MRCVSTRCLQRQGAVALKRLPGLLVSWRCVPWGLDLETPEGAWAGARPCCAHRPRVPPASAAGPPPQGPQTQQGLSQFPSQLTAAASAPQAGGSHAPEAVPGPVPGRGETPAQRGASVLPVPQRPTSPRASRWPESSRSSMTSGP